MVRMGHDNPRAALIYQHATSGADRAVAAALDTLLKVHERDEGPVSSGHFSDTNDDGDDGSAGVLAKIG